MARADVVVVGAGIVGCATAYELTRRGRSVVLVDRGEVSGGTTGLGEGNALCADKDAGPELDLAVAGMAVLDEHAAVVGEAARMRRKGALIVHPDEGTWAVEPARCERLRAAGVDAQLLGPEEVRGLEPRLTGALHGALFVATDVQCDPRGLARGLAAASGATVREHTEVAHLHPERGVRLADGEWIEASEVVLTAGPWSGPLAAAAGVHLPLEPRKGQLTRLRLPVPDPGFVRRKIVDGSYLLAVGTRDAARQVSTVVETTWDGHVIVGSSRERCGFDSSVDLELALEVRARAARLVPALADQPVDATWVGFRPWLPDHLPAIGRSDTGLWVGTGHEGAGVVLGPVTGRLLAQAITGERPEVDLAAFDPGRFATVRS